MNANIRKSVVTILALSCIAFAWIAWHGPFYEFVSYYKVALGMSRQEVREKLGTPDMVFVLNETIIEYYDVPEKEIVSDWLPSPKIVDSVAQLPEIYGTLQVVFDKSDTVAALAWAGESAVETRHGSFSGKGIGSLPSETLTRC